MRWQTPVTLLALLLAWGAFLQWQYQGYRHERELIDETLHQQAHSVMNALIGGIRSHRHLGFYFDAQIQGALEELAKSEDVLAVAVVSENGKLDLSAGETDRVSDLASLVPGRQHTTAGYLFVERFRLSPLAEPEGRGTGRGSGRGSGRGGGRGSGGRPWWRSDEEQQTESPLPREASSRLQLSWTRRVPMHLRRVLSGLTAWCRRPEHSCLFSSRSPGGQVYDSSRRGAGPASSKVKRGTFAN